MTSEQELLDLIEKASQMGADVNVTYCEHEKKKGWNIIDTVQVIGIKGIGHYPMTPIAAAETLREYIARRMQ